MFTLLFSSSKTWEFWKRYSPCLPLETLGLHPTGRPKSETFGNVDVDTHSRSLTRSYQPQLLVVVKTGHYFVCLFYYFIVFFPSCCYVSFLFLSSLVLSCIVISCIFLSCPIFSYLILLHYKWTWIITSVAFVSTFWLYLGQWWAGQRSILFYCTIFRFIIW